VNARVDVLIPTCNRPHTLATTLISLAGQTMPDLRILVSDQSEGDGILQNPQVLAVLRFMNATGRPVQTWTHLPRRGMAEQRAFLLAKVNAPYCLFLDDDVLLERDLIERMHRTIADQGCGFVGSAPHGLNHIDTARLQHQHIEFWEGKVEPELVAPNTPAWERHHLHSTANLFHVQQKLELTGPTRVSIAWRGSAVACCSILPSCATRMASTSGTSCRPNTAARTCSPSFR
jgi:hypothetical protein